MLFINIFKGYTWKKICSLACLKVKTEEKGETKFTFFYIKNRFGHFWEFEKNIKQLLISNFIIGDCSLLFKEGFCKFSHKNIHN